jgi:hypothetical protein
VIRPNSENMRTRVKTASVVVLISAALHVAAAEAESLPFSGRWIVEGPGSCRPADGPIDLVLTITDKTLDFYASSCAVTSNRRISKSGQTAYRLKTRCSGEGNTTKSTFVLALLEPNENRNELLLLIASDWSIQSYRRCTN